MSGIKINTKKSIISPSQNISLYPALAQGKDQIVCSWYEYSSSTEPARSDIYCALTTNGDDWSSPVNVSSGISYNNGPSIIYAHDRYYLAWHSWRPPGKEPFTPGGSISNIWLSYSSDGFRWSDPVLVFPQLDGSRYASLVNHPTGIIKLFFYQHGTSQLRFSQSIDGHQWCEPKILPETLATGHFPDAAIGSDGRHAFVWIDQKNPDSIALSVSDDGVTWTQPGYMSVHGGKQLTRPKVSFSEEGKIWVSCHSNQWGSFRRQVTVNLDKSKLKIKMIAGDRPGSSCWTLNTLKITSLGVDETSMLFSFGPDEFKIDPSIIRVTEEDWRYSKEKGWGFDAPVKSILRELGDELTRTMVLCEEPRTFTVDQKKGLYNIEIVYSSWISPIPGFTFEFPDGQLIRCEDGIEPEQIILFEVEKDLKWKGLHLKTDHIYDCNRPSKILPGRSADEAFLSWTQYGPDKIDIVSSFIKI